MRLATIKMDKWTIVIGIVSVLAFLFSIMSDISGDSVVYLNQTFLNDTYANNTYINQYDQSLNTTDRVIFNGVTINYLESNHTVSAIRRTDVNGSFYFNRLSLFAVVQRQNPEKI